MFWAWCGTPVLHEEYHLLCKLREREYTIMEGARKRVKEWQKEDDTKA